MPNTSPNPPASVKVIDLITNALQEIGALAQGETASNDDAGFALKKLNRIRDRWASQRLFTYSQSFSPISGNNAFVLTPNLNPHLIGPGPGQQFTVNQRPVRIENANIILTGSSPNLVRAPLNIRDADWWARQRVPSVTTTIPTDLYYEPTWPNGSLFLWPVPSFAYPLELQTWTLISFFNLNDTFTLPPGYEEAFTLTLAEGLCPAFGRQVDPELARNAQQARMAIQGNNGKSPRMTTDFTLDRPEHYRGNYLNGWMR